MLEFATKLNINGNRLSLRVYLDSKKYDYGHFIVTYHPIIITKKELEFIAYTLQIEGFKESK